MAATNQNLAQMVKDRRFREDLYYRLNVITVYVPPLREKVEDIRLLAQHFLRVYAAKNNRTLEGLTPEAIERLESYAWPGNVRELENVIERAVILSRGPDLEVPPEAVPAVAVATAPAERDPEALQEVERQHIVTVLKKTGWRVDGPKGAARLLNMHPSTLRSRMQKLGIRRSAAELS